MREIVPLKYCFPRLDFNVRPSESQHFRVQLAEYSEDYETNAEWETVTEDLEVSVTGDIDWGDLEFNSLLDNTEYVIRFTDALSRNYDFKFKTGLNMGLDDSPYYNKTLFPGQIYDWYVPSLNEIGQPTTDECSSLWRLDSHKGVTAPIKNLENWGSFSYYRFGELYDTFEPTQEDGSWYTANDKDGYSFIGAHINNTGIAKPECIGLPAMRYDADAGRYTFWHAYWYNAGGGGILANDVNARCSGGNGLAFAFYIQEEVETDITICGWDSTTYGSYPSDDLAHHSWKLIYTADGHLKTVAHLDGQEDSVATSTQTFDKNKWYFIVLSTSSSVGHTVYVMDPMTEDFSQGYTTQTVPSVSPKVGESYMTDMIIDEESGLVDNITWGLPFLFGDENTRGLVVCNAVIDPVFNILYDDTEWSSLILRVMNSDLFVPRVQLSGTTSKGSWQYLLPTQFNVVITDEKLSYLVDPEIFSTVPELTGIPYNQMGSVRADMLVDGKIQYSQTYSGFSYTDPRTSQTVNVGGIIDNESYIENSFDLKFSECENPIKDLACFFFTKHGSWGGYNGGVNGHNLYFNAEGNLILECHGDEYLGTLQGVGRESAVRPYTGYGATITYDQNAWDQRARKMTARVGTALVSNRYFHYGRIDVTMKLPVGTWGVCPAIWLFHYIEVSETDYRYNTSPYNERNEQGSGDAGHYRVINNEIDIELPSHVTNGVLPSWSDLASAYFDKDILDTELHIGVESGSATERGLWRLNDVQNANSQSAWVKVANSYNLRYNPSYQNIKFNNWQGELNAGDGWCLPQVVSGHTITAEDYYKGTDEYDPNHKEEYHSKLIHLVDNPNGYADGQFHKWSFIWLPDRTIVLVDDVIVRENKGFVPFNQMKLTLAMWFPTMPAVSNGESTIGVLDRDGIHGTVNGILTTINDSASTSIGTWAGTQANFEICHTEVSEIKYTKYNVGDDIEVNGTTTHISAAPQCYGESFPESGLRMFVE